MSETIFGNWKPFKNVEKFFLFHLKSSFCSQDIEVFVLTFGGGETIPRTFSKKSKLSISLDQ